MEREDQVSFRGSLRETAPPHDVTARVRGEAAQLRPDIVGGLARGLAPLHAGQVPRDLSPRPADAGMVRPEELCDLFGFQRHPNPDRNGLLASLALGTDHGPATNRAASHNRVMLSLHVSCLQRGTPLQKATIAKVAGIRTCCGPRLVAGVSFANEAGPNREARCVVRKAPPARRKNVRAEFEGLAHLGAPFRGAVLWADAPDLHLSSTCGSTQLGAGLTLQGIPRESMIEIRLPASALSWTREHGKACGEPRDLITRGLQVRSRTLAGPVS